MSWDERIAPLLVATYRSIASVAATRFTDPIKVRLRDFRVQIFTDGLKTSYTLAWDSPYGCLRVPMELRDFNAVCDKREPAWLLIVDSFVGDLEGQFEEARLKQLTGTP